MNWIDGVSKSNGPPLRMSYAAERRNSARDSVDAAASVDSVERERELASTLDQRISATLSKIRIDAQVASTPRASANPPSGQNPAGAGARLDILA